MRIEGANLVRVKGVLSIVIFDAFDVFEAYDDTVSMLFTQKGVPSTP